MGLRLLSPRLQEVEAQPPASISPPGPGLHRASWGQQDRPTRPTGLQEPRNTERPTATGVPHVVPGCWVKPPVEATGNWVTLVLGRLRAAPRAPGPSTGLSCGRSKFDSHTLSPAWGLTPCCPSDAPAWTLVGQIATLSPRQGSPWRMGLGKGAGGCQQARRQEWGIGRAPHTLPHGPATQQAKVAHLGETEALRGHMLARQGSGPRWEQPIVPKPLLTTWRVALPPGPPP